MGFGIFDKIYKYVNRESKEEREERERKEREAERKLLLGATSAKPAKLMADNSDLVSKTRRQLPADPIHQMKEYAMKMEVKETHKNN